MKETQPTCLLKPIVPQMNTSVPLLHTCMYTCMRMILCLHTIIIRCTPSSMSSMIIQYVITLLFITKTRHSDRDVVVFAQSEEVKIVNAFPVHPSTRGTPPRSRLAKPSRLLRCSSPVPQPTSDATGIAPHMRGMRGEKTSAMAEGTTRTNQRVRELDEGMGSGSGGDGRTQPDVRRDGY